MNFKPILFSTLMVQAILEGRKTMTRRVVKLADGSNPDEDCISYHLDNSFDKVMDFSKTYPYWKELKCPFGEIGTILWVRETFANSLNRGEFCYKADTDNSIYLDKNWKWKPSLFMPKSACRIFLKITDIKVERLQEISEDDAIKEGVLSNGKGYYKAYFDSAIHAWIDKAYLSFISLWKSINGEQSWNDNPFVWVISFEKTEKPFNF